MPGPPPTYSPTQKTIYGTHQSFHVLPFQIDRTNLFIGRVEEHVYEAWNTMDTTRMSLRYGKTVGAASGINSLAAGGHEPPWCVGVERRYDSENSMGIYTYTFEGIATDHSIPYIEYELEFTMSQEPIEGHPNFQRLNEVFGPYDSINRLWPPIITQAAAATGLKVATTGGAVSNPMYGVTSYLVPGCIYRITFTQEDVDSGFLNGVGAIDAKPTKLSDNFSNFNEILKKAGGNRNWMKMAPKVRQHGSCVQITEEWMLSGPRGWLDDIYSERALAGQSL